MHQSYGPTQAGSGRLTFAGNVQRFTSGYYGNSNTTAWSPNHALQDGINSKPKCFALMV